MKFYTSSNWKRWASSKSTGRMLQLDYPEHIVITTDDTVSLEFLIEYAFQFL
jgi:hypothetical protein